jgi:hypothetical protein
MLPSGYLGRVVLRAQPPVYVNLMRYQYVVATRRVEAGETEVVFELDRDDRVLQPATLRFRVVDAATRAPVEKAMAMLDGSGSRTSRVDGAQHEITDLDPGRYVLRAYPKVELRLWNGTSRRVHDELVDGRVDLGLIVNPGKHPDTVITPLFEDTVELFHCFPPDRIPDPAATLSSIPLIYVPELLQSQEILRQLAKRRIAPSRPLPCSSLELVKSLVLDRVGVGILPRRVAEHRTARKLRSLSPPLPLFRDRVALVRRYDVPRTAAIRAVIDHLLARTRV